VKGTKQKQTLGGPSNKQRDSMQAQMTAARAGKTKEEASWEEAGKKLLAKDNRKKEAEAKADVKLASAQTRKALEEAEAASFVPKSKKGLTSAKITQAEIARRQALAAMASQTKAQAKTQPKLEPNRNREGAMIEATGLGAAVAALSALDSKPTASKVAQKREMEQAFADFEERTMAELREEKPGLRRQQLREHMVKLWARSPDNPARHA